MQTCNWYDIFCFLVWLQSELNSLISNFWDFLQVSAGSAFAAIPVPQFLLNADSFAIPNTVAWVLSPFQLEYGISILVSSYIARFILRRIPFIG